MKESLDKLTETIQKAKHEIKKVIVGQDDVVDLCLVTIFTGQHALIEGSPGIGKTLLVRTLANILDASFNRIQFTPDLMPSDITGTNVFDLKKNEFNFFQGPLFTTFLLGDEINRAPAKTQSAMLQAMQERKVSVDQQTYDLDPHFTVFATQNPMEYDGTYPLPEAQKDRFMFKILMHPPELEEERELARNFLKADTPEKVLDSGEIQKVLSRDELLDAKNAAREVMIKEDLIDYAVELIRRTRVSEVIQVGAGPRATQSLLLASRMSAILHQRDFVSPDDIKSIAPAILEHRLVLKPEFELEGMSERSVVENILKDTPIPK